MDKKRENKRTGRRSEWKDEEEKKGKEEKTIKIGKAEQKKEKEKKKKNNRTPPPSFPPSFLCTDKQAGWMQFNPLIGFITPAGWANSVSFFFLSSAQPGHENS